MSAQSNVAIVRAYVAAVEELNVEAVGELLDPSIVQTEYPNKLFANGKVRSGAQMLSDLPRARSLLRRQSYAISTIFEEGEMVAVEATWKGILDVPLGRLQAGDTMVAHLCMVFTVRNGRIVAQKNYDCYEDFAA